MAHMWEAVEYQVEDYTVRNQEGDFLEDSWPLPFEGALQLLSIVLHKIWCQVLSPQPGRFSLDDIVFVTVEGSELNT